MGAVGAAYALVVAMPSVVAEFVPVAVEKLIPTTALLGSLAV